MTQDQTIDLRKIALEMAKWINRNIQSMSIDNLKNDAEIIYQWLIT